MPDLSIPLLTFIEIVAALAAAPAIGYYTWKGVRRRRAGLNAADAPRRLPPR